MSRVCFNYGVDRVYMISLELRFVHNEGFGINNVHRTEIWNIVGISKLRIITDDTNVLIIIYLF